MATGIAQSGAWLLFDCRIESHMNESRSDKRKFGKNDNRQTVAALTSEGSRNRLPNMASTTKSAPSRMRPQSTPTLGH